jgi:peptide/nickel transport system substrate-binding protein
MPDLSRLKTGFLFVALVFALLSATAGGLARAQQPGAAVPRAIRVAQTSDPTGFFPADLANIPNVVFYRNVFDCLVERSPDGKLIPRMAKSWRLVNQTTWEFELQPNIRFHDGSPADARAVAAYFDFILNADNKIYLRTRFPTVKQVTATGATTLRFITESPDPLIPNRLDGWNCGIPSARRMTEVGLDRFREQPLGSGRYKLVEWRRQESVTLVRNTQWIGGLPPVERFIIRPIPDQASRVSALLNSEVDLIVSVDPDSVPVIERSRNAKIVTTKMFDWILYYPQAKSPRIALESKEFRQALSLAIDRESIARRVLRGFASPMKGFLPDTNPAHDPRDSWAYDTGRARELLRRSGYQGEEIRFYTGDNIFIGDRIVTEAVVQMLAEVGVNAKMVVLEAGERARLRREKSWEGFMILLGGDTLYDPDVWWNWIQPGGIMDAYRNPRFDEMMKRCATIFEPRQRYSCYRAPLAILKDDVPSLQVVQVQFIDAVTNQWNWVRRPDESMILSDFRFGGRR